MRNVNARLDKLEEKASVCRACGFSPAAPGDGVRFVVNHDPQIEGEPCAECGRKPICFTLDISTPSDGSRP